MNLISYKQQFSISIAVFYNSFDWSDFILDCLIPFINDKKEVNSYIISLSRNRGDHIKIFLITPKLNALEIANQADKYFKSYISGKFPKESKTEEITENDIFRNFEPNTIHYGVYDNYSFDEVYGYKNLDYEFSRLLILIFEKNRNQTIYFLTEILIELLASFFDCLECDQDDIIEVVDELIEKELKKYNPDQFQKVIDINERNFIDNREAITLFLRAEKGQSELYKQSKNIWNVILEKFDTSYSNLKSQREAFLINKLCDILYFKDRIKAFYLYSKGIRLIANNETSSLK